MISENDLQKALDSVQTIKDICERQFRCNTCPFYDANNEYDCCGISNRVPSLYNIDSNNSFGKVFCNDKE